MAIYVNKRIPRSHISEIQKERDLISLRISTTKEDIYIYNLYIKPKPYSIKNIPPILHNLKKLLENKEGHIILEDLNLHYSLWNGLKYNKYHYIANELLDIVGGIEAILYTLEGLLIRNY